MQGQLKNWEDLPQQERLEKMKLLALELKNNGIDNILPNELDQFVVHLNGQPS